MSRSDSKFRRVWDQAGMLIVFGVLFTVCSVQVEGFLSSFNMKSLLLAVSTIGIVSCTMLFCLASGAFDLSVGSIVACVGVVTAVMTNNASSILQTVLHKLGIELVVTLGPIESAAFGISAGLALGALVGFLNGTLIARMGINALIATLATMQIVRGLGYIVNNGNSVGVVNEAFYSLGSAAFPSAELWTSIGLGEETAGKLSVPLPIWICVFCFALFWFLLERTTFGRNTLAIGGNLEAARLAGVPVRRVRVTIFALQGLLAAVAGIVLTSRMTMGDPKVAQGLELDVIAACVLGGVSLTGGIGRMGHVIAGVLIMGTVRNSMNLLNVPTFYQYVASGLILLAAVGLDLLKQRRKN